MGRGKIRKQLIASLPQNCFWVNNGPILSDLKELHQALAGEITPEQYAHHVSSERNDFADWVGSTLGDQACAKKLRAVKKQSTAVSTVKACLQRYTE